MWLTILFYIVAGLYVLKYFLRYLLKTFYWGEIDRQNEIDIKGKIVIITGANTGIGKATAQEIADRGATVILACRNFVSAKEAILDIEKKTTNGKLIAMKLDLASLDSIREFVMEFKNKFNRLHILINNAGVFIPVTDKVKTKDGFEVHFGVNHLGSFLLTNLLLDTIKMSAPARIINVSSGVHHFSNLNLDDVNGEKVQLKESWVVNDLYAASKMANILFTKELGKRLEGTGVQTYALCPGFVKSDVFRYSKLSQFIFLNLALEFFGKSVEEGCQTTLFCALSKHKDVTGKTGEMYQNCSYWPSEKRKAVKDEDAIKLWKISEKLINNVKNNKNKLQ